MTYSNVNYVTVPISKDNKRETFTVNAKYRIIRKVGSGAYGTVCSAFDLQHQQYCAIKKAYRVFDKMLFTKRCLREMKLLRLFNNHPRIITLFDMDMVFGSQEIYLIFNCMDASLHDVIHSNQPLDTVHSQWFLFQILSGLQYIHRANVIHRDLKPANILVNKDCDIRICDFGMARSFDQTDNTSYLTEYVTTRWYRAPEVMISSQNYSKAIDIWSVGCIFGEILGRKVLFQGQNYIDQLHKILGLLGLPEDISFWDPTEYVLEHIQNICTTDGLPPPTGPVDFKVLFPTCPEYGIEFLYDLLQLDPGKRVTVEQALRNSFLSSFSDPCEESLVPPQVLPHQYDFEHFNNDESLKTLIIQEIESFKQENQECELELEEQQYYNSDSLRPRRYHTMAADTESLCATPTQKLDHLPSATMSLFEPQQYNTGGQEQETVITTSGSTIYAEDQELVGEPEELEEDENYVYLCNLIKENTPGVLIEKERQLKEPENEIIREKLERALTGTW